MSSRSSKSVETNKARPATGRRLIIAVVVLLIVALIVLVAGVVFMQKEIRTTKSTLEGLKTLEGKSTFLFHLKPLAAYTFT